MILGNLRFIDMESVNNKMPMSNDPVCAIPSNLA